MTLPHSPDQVDALRSRLTARRKELAQRLGRVDRDLRHQSAPLSADLDEQAVERTNDDVLDAISMAVREELEQIDTALSRLAAGQYGRCSVCGAGIEPGRLVAVPYTNTCSHCVDG
jgi:RNA polymerase-binding transcription factor DksA